MFDILIKNARVIDGTCAPWYYAEIGIEGDRITFIGKDPKCKAKILIDANGKYVVPGFIDSHTHMEIMPFLRSKMPYRTYQGVTTLIGGSCGLGVAPIKKEIQNDWNEILGVDRGIEYPWQSFNEFVDYSNSIELGTNIMSTIPHGLVRYMVIGLENRICTHDELEEMKKIVDTAMKQGALGLSAGLIFPPCMYANTYELIELCKIISKYDGVFTVHMRNESYNLIEAVEEVINIAKESKVKLQISHHKVTGKDNWGKVHRTVEIIKEARSDGVDVMVDQYPYDFSSNNLTTILPPNVVNKQISEIIELFNDKKEREKIIYSLENDITWENFWKQVGSSDNIVIGDAPNSPEYNGYSILELANKYNLEPIDMAFKIIEENGHGVNSCYMSIWDQDVKHIMKQKFTMIGSDSFPVNEGSKCHPRQNGTFPRFLEHYCKKEKLFSLEEAIFKITGLPASRFCIKNRGLIKKGNYADLVVLDYENIKDNTSIKEPFKKPNGIDYVINNGEIVLENGKLTGKISGRYLKH